jgi:hypothetical protein
MERIQGIISCLDQEISIVRAQLTALQLHLKELKRELELTKAWLVVCGNRKQVAAYEKCLADVHRHIEALRVRLNAVVVWIVDCLVGDFIAENRELVSSLRKEEAGRQVLHYVIVLKCGAAAESWQMFTQFLEAFRLFDYWGDVLIRFDLTVESRIVDVPFVEVMSS